MQMRNDPDQEPSGNLEIVFVDWLDAMRRRDIDRMAARLATDVVHQGVRSDLVCRGRDAVVARLQTRVGHTPRVTELELVEAGDRVLLGIRAAGVGVPVAEDGPPRGEAFIVFTFRDGLIVRMDDYLSRDEALAAPPRA